jgi:hypothetical protein
MNRTPDTFDFRRYFPDMFPQVRQPLITPPPRYCGATANGCVCTRPQGHGAAHYDSERARGFQGSAANEMERR